MDKLVINCETNKKKKPWNIEIYLIITFANNSFLLQKIDMKKY